MSGRAKDAEEFRQLFAATAVRVRGFVRRHVDEAECDDVLLDIYLVAWRRFGDVPPVPLPWLLAAARRVLANHWRGRDRRLRRKTEARGVGFDFAGILAFFRLPVTFRAGVDTTGCGPSDRRAGVVSCARRRFGCFRPDLG